MKASMAISLRDLITTKHDAATWKKVMYQAGVPETTIFMAVGDIEDSLYLSLVKAGATELGYTGKEMWDAIADHWISAYTQKVYSQHYKGIDNVRDLFVHMNEVHELVTRASRGARPPSFTFEYPNPQSMIIGYVSERDLFDYFVSLVGAVGRHYKEDVSVHRMGNNRVRLVFN